MDKDISFFLDENTWTMGDDNLDSDIWKAYHGMCDKYSVVKQQLREVEYYMRGGK